MEETVFDTSELQRPQVSVRPIESWRLASCFFSFHGFVVLDLLLSVWSHSCYIGVSLRSLIVSVVLVLAIQHSTRWHSFVLHFSLLCLFFSWTCYFTGSVNTKALSLLVLVEWACVLYSWSTTMSCLVHRLHLFSLWCTRSSLLFFDWLV